MIPPSYQMFENNLFKSMIGVHTSDCAYACSLSTCGPMNFVGVDRITIQVHGECVAER